MLQSNLPKNTKVFANFLAELSDRDRVLLIERFYRKKPMEKVAQQFNITRSRVQQIEDRLITEIELAFSYINAEEYIKKTMLEDKQKTIYKVKDWLKK